MNPTIVFKLAIITYVFAICSAQQGVTNGEWMLRLLHTNDMYSRFSQTSKWSTDCLPKQAKAGQCFGGFARLATLIREARNFTVPTIFLNAGDTFSGTKWFRAHKWRIVSDFLNILNPDVICLGDHEFDIGIDQLIPFINAAKFPIVTANVDLKNEPELAATKLRKSVIIETSDGHKIGVIGYLTPDTERISLTGKVIFLDEIESIKKEVEQLQAQDVNILIALGHSGFEVDKRIAAEVDGLDLVIGAHDNTFLYNGPKPDLEDPVGPYPTEVLGVKGRKVYVVQAYAFTKYLGHLEIAFDSAGEITKISGRPLLLDSQIAEAPDVLEKLRKWEPAVTALKFETVGSTKVYLDGSRAACCMGECNLGNMITDAMVDYNIKEYAGSEGWTDAAIAMVISGTIRTSIGNSLITSGNVIDVLPFVNGMVKMDLTGDIIHQMLEHSVDRLINSPNDLSGAFLQVSGLEVTYDISQTKGKRVAKVFVRCARCEIPTFEELVKNKTYTVLTMDFMAYGGEDYLMLPEIKSNPMGVSLDEVLIDYLSRWSPVHAELEGRIKILHPELLVSQSHQR